MLLALSKYGLLTTDLALGKNRQEEVSSVKSALAPFKSSLEKENITMLRCSQVRHKGGGLGRGAFPALDRCSFCPLHV